MTSKGFNLSLALLLSLPTILHAMSRSDLLPPTTQGSLRISNTVECWNKLKESSFGKLWIDQQFQDFLGNPTADTFIEHIFSSEMDEEDQIMLEQFKMITGEVVVAFGPESEDQPFIIAAMSEADYLRSLSLDEKIKEVTDDPFNIQRTTFQDIKVFQHIHNPGTADEYSLWQTFMHGTLLSGPSKEWIERSIVRLKKEAIDEPKGLPQVTFNLALSKLIQETKLKELKEAATNNPSEPDPELMFQALGLMDIGNLNATFTLNDHEMVADIQLQVSDLTKGIFSILDTSPSSLPNAAFIPANISSLEVGRFNLLKFWQEIPKILGSTSPMAGPQFAMAISFAEQAAGIRIEQDLLANIGSSYLSYAVAGLNEQNSVIAIELNDSSAFKRALETLMASPNLQAQIAAAFEIEPFQDHTIYTVKNATGANFSAFAVVDGYLTLGQPNGVRQLLRSMSDDGTSHQGFENSDLVRGLRLNIPSNAFGFNVVDWNKSMQAVVELIRTPQTAMMLTDSLSEVGLTPDMDKFPPAEHIASFFKTSYNYIEATRTGLHSKTIFNY